MNPGRFFWKTKQCPTCGADDSLQARLSQTEHELEHMTGRAESFLRQGEEAQARLDAVQGEKERYDLLHLREVNDLKRRLDAVREWAEGEMAVPPTSDFERGEHDAADRVLSLLDPPTEQ